MECWICSHRKKFPNPVRFPGKAAAIPVNLWKGVNVTNHRRDKRRPSRRLQCSAELPVPTCTCYPYAVKFISRVSATDHHGSYLRFHTWPCLYAPNCRDSWNKTGEIERGQTETKIGYHTFRELISLGDSRGSTGQSFTRFYCPLGLACNHIIWNIISSW